ncbi:MAG TPA: enoyl-CoA hydratase [Acetobacteraceae bacterium]|nr:enoyl-CoA hydratase [Acetobacteraceae bacterium]
MPDLLETIEDGVAVLTLNRPERLNALSPDIYLGLRESLPRLAADEAVGAIVITGAGRGFCAGGDVKTMEARSKAQSFEQRLERYRTMHQIPLMMRTLPKVIIGMINGPAFGAGLGLALACDLRIAGRSARFGTAFVKVGFSGDFGGSWLLTRLVGTAKARELYFLGDQVTGEEAAALGIANRVVDDGALAETTMALARRIAEGPRIALGYMKRNLHAAETEPFATVLEMEGIHQARAGETEDHREAVAAFNEKRKPRFPGR